MTLVGNVHEFDDLREHALGWRGLLDGLRVALERVAAAHNVTIHVDRVKEKFGGLSCYVTVQAESVEASRQVEMWIDAAENVSYLLCYLCGAGVTRRGAGSWTRYFCAEHNNVDLRRALHERWGTGSTLAPHVAGEEDAP